MMKFYMTPGSCSTGIHILLEEVEAIFEVHLVNLMKGDQHTEAYLEINPKGTIPTLVRDDGLAFTDFQSIAWWLAKTYPEHGLIPDELEGEVRLLETMNFIVGKIHGEGFTRIFTTDQYTQDQDQHEMIQAQGRSIIQHGLKLVDGWLVSKEYLLTNFGIADVALFYVAFWADRIEMPLPHNVQAHYRRMLDRPAVRQVLMEEGYASVYR
jgi:glutathione S-transferase